MYEIDGTYLAYELAYRAERLTGRRSGEHAHHASPRRGERTLRGRGLRLGRTRRG